MGTTKKKISNNFGAKGWGMIIYCAVLMYLGGSINTYGGSLFSTQIAELRGWEYSEILKYFTYGGWIAVVVSILAAVIVAKKGAKIVAVIALICGGISVGCIGLATTKAAYAVCVIISCSALVAYSNLVPNTLMNSWFPRTKGIALGWSTMGYPAGDVLFTVMFYALIGFGITLGFIGLGIILIVVAVITAFAVKNTPEEANAYPDNDKSMTKEQLDENMSKLKNYKSDWTVKRLLTNKNTWLIGLGLGFCWMSVVGVVGYFVPRMVSLGFERTFAVSLLSICGFVGFIGSYIWGLIDQKIGTRRTCQIYALYYVAEFILLLTVKNGTAMYFVAVMAGFGTGGIGNLIPSMIGSKWGRYDYAAAQKVMGPLTNFLKGSVALVVSFCLTNLNGYTSFYIIAMILSAIAFVMFLFVDDEMIGHTE